MVPWRSSILLTAILVAVGLISDDNWAYRIETAIAQSSATTEDNFTCPDDLKALTALLLKDLPAYSNRVIQRTQDRNQAAGVENYLITASAAELEPLELPRLQYNPTDHKEPKQVFFTVFERQYIDRQIVDIQTYHWLFLTQTDSGWRTVMMFSRFGNSAEDRPPCTSQRNYRWHYRSRCSTMATGLSRWHC